MTTNTNNEYNTFGKQIGYTVFANIVALIVGLLRTPLLTKGLGASGFGTFSLIHISVSLIVPFATLGYRTAIVRFLAAETNKAKIREDFLSGYALIIISSTFFSFILFLLADLLAEQILHDSSVANLIKLGSLLILTDALFNISIAFFRMRRNIGIHTIFSSSRQLLELALYATVLTLGYQLIGVISSQIVIIFIIDLVCFVVILRFIGFTIPKFSNIKKYLKWGFPLTPNAAILWIISVSDRYMIGYFLGSVATGIYSASYSIANYATFLLSPIGIVLFPTISKAYDEGDIEKTRKFMKYSLKYLMMIAIPAATGISILAVPFVQILTTNEFIEGAVVIPWVTAGVVLNSIFQTYIYVVHLVNKTHITIRLLSIAAILNIGLNILLIPQMNILGAAIATLAAYTVLGILTVIVTRRYMKFDHSLPFIGKSIVASAVMAVCIWLIDPESLLMVIVSVVLGASIYFGILLLLRGLSKQEITFFLNFARDNAGKVLKAFRKKA